MPSYGGDKDLKCTIGRIGHCFTHMAFWIENDKLCNGALSYKVHRCDVRKMGHYFNAIGILHLECHDIYGCIDESLP